MSSVSEVSLHDIDWDLFPSVAPVCAVPPAGASTTAVHTHRQVQTDNKLVKHCEWRGLLLGQYAITKRVGVLPYFQQYGLSMEAMVNLRSCYLEHFAKWFGATETAQALANVEAASGLTRCWVPKFLHVYQHLGLFYPNFRWVVDVARHAVVFTNYPRDEDGRRPTLYDLVTRLTVLDAKFRDPPRKPRQRVRRKTFRFSVAGHVEDIRVRCWSR